LAQRADPIRAREAARNAAELGRESATAAALAPDAATLTRAEQLAQRAGLRVKELTERLDRTRDNGRTRIRIGLAMRALAPREVKDLHRVITAPHRQITVELRRAATKLAPEHLRDLTHWARSPHLALPTSAARSFRALLNDRKMERGSE
jgi:hypothetical protein